MSSIFVAYAQKDEPSFARFKESLKRYIDATLYFGPDCAPKMSDTQDAADYLRSIDCKIFITILSVQTIRSPEFTLKETTWARTWEQLSPDERFYIRVVVDDRPQPDLASDSPFIHSPYLHLPEGIVTPEFGTHVRDLLKRRPTGLEERDDAIAPSISIQEWAPASVPLRNVGSKKALIQDENVQFTVYRPKVLVPQKWHTMLAFAHLSEKAADSSPDDPDPLKEVARQARQILENIDEYGRTNQDSMQGIPRDGEITMVPSVRGLVFNPPRRTFLWQVAVHREEFRLKTTADALDPDTVFRGGLTIFLGAVIIAEIPLRFQLGATPSQNFESAQARPYRRIFASYSHKDTAVVERIEHYANAIGDTYLRDALNLRSGQDWNAELLHMIDRADLFQLFWSSNSRQSPYCRQEWEYATRLNRASFIRPTYWEDPFPPTDVLPPEIARLHFQKIASSRLPETTESEYPTAYAEAPSPANRPDRSAPIISERMRPLAEPAPMPPPPVAMSASGSRHAFPDSPPPEARSSGGGGSLSPIAIVIAIAVVLLAALCFYFFVR
jgi:hypothetical protein